MSYLHCMFRQRPYIKHRKTFIWLICFCGEKDILLPDEEEGFICMRVPIADTETEDVNVHFEKVFHFINGAIKNETGVLVHCHEGKSRSVALILAYLMKEKGWTLRKSVVS